jgi:hypothetical protein
MQSKPIALSMQQASDRYFWLCIFALICLHISATPFGDVAENRNALSWM